ncbi:MULTISPECIES: disulfide bond formation protein B [Ralstonia solanacearum species complex]|uniref:disulfide bond formation protein B n=1 Tax=Ralstonia solanacearum species complex TaxID=3116862 RepID=UPI000E5932CA|nr:disulfide bond formation protein B [Ralstonia solanacearum]BEU73777.1 disulfide bond formation protein B [Ralstonia pseudosolanacearum]AXV78716.1 disulfide bond formation protein B [Ralstonia solanacearum]AXV92737.1 disulfide bond formation protein B [Ralstonia solanacearum]AXW20811.1 disulfide bond formation protein B [Ralstonia solanacearum]AXW77634.1 disulfide bond formation protein B [Ralstonia solanacearum]
MSSSLSVRLNTAGLFGVSAILLYAFVHQLVLHDLPCPLCLLQRGCFIAAGVGLALNLRFGSRPAHYALMILASLAGAAIAGRQILLHIVPGTGTYGEALWGLHLYTLAFIAFSVMIVGTAVMLFLERSSEADEGPALVPPSRAALTAVVLLAVLTLGNVVGTFLECGGGMCADDPVIYELLGR